MTTEIQRQTDCQGLGSDIHACWAPSSRGADRLSPPPTHMPESIPVLRPQPSTAKKREDEASRLWSSQQTSAPAPSPHRPQGSSGHPTNCLLQGRIPSSNSQTQEVRWEPCLKLLAGGHVHTDPQLSAEALQDESIPTKRCVQAKCFYGNAWSGLGQVCLPSEAFYLP